MNFLKYKAKIKFLFLIIAMLIIWYLGWNLGRQFRLDAQSIGRYLGNFPLIYSGSIFVILYVGVTFFVWLSKDIFRFSGAILFGAYWSTVLVLIAEILNAIILFGFSRSLGRDFVKDSLKGRYASLDQKVGKASFFWLFLFRCVPLIPFRFLDLAAGLTTISFYRYLSAVIIGSPLRIFWQQYAFATFKEAVFNPFFLAKEIEINPASVLPLFLLTFIYLVLIIVITLRLKQKD